MIKKVLAFIALFILNCVCFASDTVERWDYFELSLNGPTGGNPFIGVRFSAVFENDETQVEQEGFYDGDGVYRVRFMPGKEGLWTYRTKSNREALNDKVGEFTCVKPSADNHGPVRIRNQYHFGYEDGTPFFVFGTTLYEWAFQPEHVRQQTLETLKSSPFNKVRMLLVPNYRDKYAKGPERLEHFPYIGDSKENWDFSRFDPEFFRHMEECIKQLQDIGIETDLILFRPYDKGKWGFDTLDMVTNERFVRYVVARFGAFRNIWWSLANENSYIKSLTDDDWDHLFQVVESCDLYGHLRSIHNADRPYDYNKPWVTHVSLQYYMAVRWPGISPMLRDLYQKPVVHDEINYEGNIESRWGQLSGEQMVYRFWNAYVGGAYVTHGEVLQTTDDPTNTWISMGGQLHGTSPRRIAFLKEIVNDGPAAGLDPIDQLFETNIGGQYGSYYLIYFGKDPITEWQFKLPKEKLKPGMKFCADLIDTWNMNITSIEQVFEVEKFNRYSYIDKDKSKIQLPGRQYMALQIKRVE